MKSMTGKILFRGFDILRNRMFGFADVFIYSMACYLKGKELGYNDVYIVFPRFGYDKLKWDVSEKARNWQRTEFSPWTYLPRDKKINFNIYDKIIDTSKPNSFYDGFPGLHEHAWFFYKYPDIYYLKTGKKPHLEVNKDDNNKRYILFQYRDSRLGALAKKKVTSTKEFHQVFNILKEQLNDRYEFWKTGEKSPIDNKFDKILPPMFEDIDGFARVIRNSSMFIGGHSGPRAFAYFMADLPIIQISQVKKINPYNNKTWSKRVGNDEVERHPNWCSDRLLSFDKRNPLFNFFGSSFIRKDKIINFIRGHNL
jgi:hypothetical protein